MSIPSISSHDWRRGFAFIGVWGGCVVAYAYICVATYLVRDNHDAVLMLAELMHIQLGLGMLALGWFGGRRLQIEATRNGITLNDREHHPANTELPQPTFGQQP